jgi:hypothetical protein
MAACATQDAHAVGAQAAAPEDALLDARSAVLEGAALLELILAAGGFDAATCASAALVCRLWARVAACDAVWRCAWRREARSLRSLEARVARPRGCGFRTALAQLRATTRLEQDQLTRPADRTADASWTMDDFTFVLDVSWRGQPVFECVAPAGRVVYGFDDERTAARLTCNTTLSHEDEGDAAGCARSLDELALTDGQPVHDLVCHLRVLRSDGALAMLMQCARRGRDPLGPKYFHELFTGPRPGGLTHVRVLVVAFFSSGADTSCLIHRCLVEFEPVWRNSQKFLQPKHLLFALSRTLSWVLPTAATGAATAIVHRVAAQPTPEEL